MIRNENLGGSIHRDKADLVKTPEGVQPALGKVYYSRTCSELVEEHGLNRLIQCGVYRRGLQRYCVNDIFNC